MAANGGREIQVIQADNAPFSSETLKEMIISDLKTPVIFKGYLSTSWLEPLTWSPKVIATKLADRVTSFKVCPKEGTFKYKELIKKCDKGVIFETDCEYIEGTFEEFIKWLEKEEEKETEPVIKKPHLEKQSSEMSPFSSFPRSEYWIYADYKYMNQLCPDELIQAIDWSVFGFEGRNGNQSSLWIGSEGCHTPCHYDTYGCNLVGQLWGSKQWTLYPPNDCLYPTRVPYEESSVFSAVNIKSPQIDTLPDFVTAKPFKVTLYPGDVLYVPYHWWHYVECLEPAVSVNTWIELPQDKEDRLKESIVRLMVSNFVTSNNQETLLNPNETLFPLEDNLSLLNMLLTQDGYQSLSLTELINILTSEPVISLIKEKVKLKK